MDVPLALDIVSPVVTGTNLAITVLSLLVELFAFVHCIFQRGDAFPALGTLPKGLWLALTGGGAVLTLALGLSPMGLIGMIGLIAGLVYVLDVRPGLKDATDGSGPW